MRFTVVQSILAAALVVFLPVGAEAAQDMSGDWTLEGSVATDGGTFAGTFVQASLVAAEGASTLECAVFTTPVTGTRCGNNQVDVWEECDFGDVEDGDCCSSTCELAGSGSACTPDRNDCTGDTC